jgi:hypothetical protein
MGYLSTDGEGEMRYTILVAERRIGNTWNWRDWFETSRTPPVITSQVDALMVESFIRKHFPGYQVRVATAKVMGVAA